MLKIVIGIVILLTDLTDAIVDCGAPAYIIDVDQSCVELGSVTAPNPTTEGAILAFSCASLLIRTKAPFDYCPVKRCKSDGLWSDAKLSCGSATECFNSSSAYEGRRTCTTSGRACQRWDTQSPHPHSYTDSSFPNNNMTESAAYCRDPDGARGEPWCFTSDPVVEWETCGIPAFTNITTGQGTCPNNYCGDPIYAFNTDNTCISYTSTTDGSRFVGSFVEYRCLSLLIGFTSQQDYCPVKVCQNDTYWSTTKLSCGTNECYTPGLSQQYQGRRTCTRTGKPCQGWDSQSPNNHTYTNAVDFPDATVAAAGSYCRDPGGGKGQPWCYTTTAGMWDYCGVQNCSSLPVNNGTCELVATTPATPTTASGSSTSSATTSAATSTSTPISSEVGDYYRYHRVNSDRTGFQKLTAIPFVKNAIGCARLCSEQYELTCVFLTFEADGTCTLYKEEILSLTNIPCATQKCYIHNNLL